MEWLESIPGQVFLLLYIMYLILIIVAGNLAARWTGRREKDATLQLDPHNIAYLKGGTTGLVQTVFFDLWKRGIMEIGPGGKAIWKVQSGLSDLEKTVARELTSCVSLPDAFKKLKYQTQTNLQPYVESIAFNLDKAGLFRWQHPAWRVGILIIGLFPGMVKSSWGLSKGLPTGFLMITMLVFLITAWLTFKPVQGPTPKGRRYMKTMARHYKQDYKAMKSGLEPQADPVLLAAVFGAVTVARAYSPLAGLFPGRVSGTGCTSGWTSSGCSSSSGCGGASGCGGGCGGCGGCGGA